MKIGSNVVYVDDFMHDEILIVSGVGDRIWLNNDDAVCIKSMVRLATTQEIQCGHRLPSIEVLHDKDIPPCTIVLER